jgi:hypothetical protein
MALVKVFDAPFTGSRLTGLTRRSTICEYIGVLDSAGNLIDVSGENLFLYSEQFGQSAPWYTSEASILSNTMLEPFDIYNPNPRLVTADTLHENGVAGVMHYVTQSIAVTEGVPYRYTVRVKKDKRSWVLVSVDTTGLDHGAFFNVETGALGTTAECTSEIRDMGDGWYLCIIYFTPTVTESAWPAIIVASADGVYVFDGLDQDSLYIFGAHLMRDQHRDIVSRIYHPTTSLSKPRFDLTRSGTPPSPLFAIANLQATDGNIVNGWRATGAGGASCFINANPGAIASAFAVNHTYTMVRIPTPTSNGISGIAYDAFGTAFIHSGGYYRYYKSGTAIYVYSPGLTANWLSFENEILINGISTAYLNGAAGTPVDVSSKISVGTGAFTIGYSNSIYATCTFVYCRIDAEVLTVAQLAQDREIIMGTAAFGLNGKHVPSTVARSTAKRVVSSTGKHFDLANATLAPSGPGGGILFEASAGISNTSRVNRMLYSEALASWTIGGTAGVTPNAIIAPDDTLSMALVTVNSGVNTVSEIATGFTNNGALATSFWVKRSSLTGYLEVENASDATRGLWTISQARLPDDPVRITPLNISQFGVINTAFTATAGGAGGIKFRSSAAVDVSNYIWGVMQENGKYSTSYIKTTTGVATANRDFISYQPFLNTGITGIGYGYKYKKLTVDFDSFSLLENVANIVVADHGFFGMLTTTPSQKIHCYLEAPNLIFQDATFSDSVQKYIGKNISAISLCGWHSFKFVFDYLEHSNCKLYMDGIDLGLVMPEFTNKAMVLDSTTILYVGSYSSFWPANASIRNFKMWLEE